MTPKAWANRVKKIAGEPKAEHVAKNGVDLEYHVDPADLGSLQDVLDMFPAGGIMRMGVVAKPTRAEKAGTDEDVQDGFVRRFTLPEDIRKGSDLIGRVFGPGGGYERIFNSYGKVMPYVIIHLRYQP